MDASSTGSSASDARDAGTKRLLAAGFRLRAETAASITPPMETDAVYAWKDRMGTVKARLGINRMAYAVTPGLYRLGQPDGNAPVLVTANYKMSFDMLRRVLAGRHAWILVLDTKGINVWCAAGKGTFGTAELVRRIKRVGLDMQVNHRRLILPQLGASGVSAPEVRRQTGFSVTYGPVRAEDLPAFLDGGMKASPEMRKVRFTLPDRVVLTPIEVVGAVRPLLLAFGVMFLLNLTGLVHFGLFEMSMLLGGVLCGAVFVPLLLPWIPGRAFALKGLVLGVLFSAVLLALLGFEPATAALVPDAARPGWLLSLSGLSVLTAISSFMGMNFTGCSTYTSPTGVRKEMMWAVPLQAVLVVLGTAGVLVARMLQAGAGY